MNASSAASEQAQLGRRVLMAITIATVVAAYALLAALPAAPFHLPFVSGEHVRSVLPEGWAFFTRSPREPEPISFRRGSDGGWYDVTERSSMSFDSALSLDRRRRSQGTELAGLVNGLVDRDWTACDQLPTQCLSYVAATHTVHNRSTHRTLCGDIGIVIQDVRPWAWHDLPTVMHSKVTRMVVTC